MNLTSKRVAATLLTLAAFTGVLLKEIPFTSSEAGVPTESRVGEANFGEMPALASGEEAPPANMPPKGEHVMPTPFVGVSAEDTPLVADRPPFDSSEPKAVFLPNLVGSGPQPSYRSPHNNGFVPAGGTGRGDLSPGNPGSKDGDTPPQTGVTPPTNSDPKPDPSAPPVGGGPGPIIPPPIVPGAGGDNGHGPGPGNPAQPPEPSGGSNDHSPAPDIDITLPSTGGGDDGPIVSPPWTDPTLPGTGDPLPGTNPPTGTSPDDTHSVPENGSSASLVLAAVLGLLALRRVRSTK